ncbi:hypothetical protein [Clostridium sp.]|uniref:hypothetical protein n=1 Tax=Clostridium sp. TaxID=1506 RepID=UPI0025C1E0C9|nr:hypothetical protein [Clostridium sp.]
MITILILCMTGAFLIALKYKGNKTERMFLLVITTLITLLLSILVIEVIIENNYPQISEKYKPLILGLILILFFISLIVEIANNIYIYKHKNKR